MTNSANFKTRMNWAGNVRYRAVGARHPESVPQLCEWARGADKIKALGARHSFSGVADTEGVLVSLDRMPSAARVNPARKTATICGGATYAAICPQLHCAGFALRNLASLPDITVAGACATATHGGGGRNKNLAAAVSALEMVSADGDIVRLSRERDGGDFAGAAVGLGALGVVVGVTLDLIPTFHARQTVYEGLEMSALMENAGEILSAAHSVSVFTDWRGGPCRVWAKRKLPEEDDETDAFFGASAQRSPRHPISGRSADGCTEQTGKPGPWHERLPHFRPGHMSDAGEELQSEYFVPLRRAREALAAVLSLGADIAPLLCASEIRAVAADDFWMSPCFGRDSLALHFTWKKDSPGPLNNALLRLESALLPLEARPHWGKLFAVSPERLRTLYPRLPDFRNLVRRLDPAGKFRNNFIDNFVFGEGG